MAQFDDANRGLIQAATDEMPVVVHHQRVKAAYDGFLPEIQAYLTALPGVLLQGLGDQARHLPAAHRAVIDATARRHPATPRAGGRARTACRGAGQGQRTLDSAVGRGKGHRG